MSHRPGRYSPLNPRVIVAVSHLAFGYICLLRPNLEVMLRAYAPLGDVEVWGWSLVSLGLLLIFVRRGSWLLMVLQLISAATLFTLALLLTSAVGPLPTAAITAWLGVVSLLLLGRTSQAWLCRRVWYQHLMAHPPSWARRLLPRLDRRREHHG